MPSSSNGEPRGAFDFPRSVSQRRAYRKCGMLYLLRYGDGYKSRTKKGTYAFGDAWQVAVQAVLQGAADSPELMYEAFMAEWARLETDTSLEWNSRNGWAFFRERAKPLARVAYYELVQMFGVPRMAAIYDQRFTYDLVPGRGETAVPDYLGPMLQYQPPGVWLAPPVETVIDWKTSDREYKPLSSELDEQLTAYQVGAERQYQRRAQQVGLCVFIYAAAPKVQWLMQPARSPEVVEQFIASAVIDDQRICRGEFPRNPNACFNMGRCEMVPVCYPSQRHLIATELEKVPSRNEQPLNWIDLEALETE